ncbi:MAG: type IV secretion system protein, partial [Pseudomonadota bacterium]
PLVLCFVEPDYSDPDNIVYKGLIPETTKQFLTAGLNFYRPMVLIMATAAIAFFGIKLMNGDVRDIRKESFLLAFKIALVINFVSGGINQFGSAQYIYNALITIMDALCTAISDATVAANPNGLCNATNYNGYSFANSLWGRFDCLFGFILGVGGASTAAVGIISFLMLIALSSGIGILIFFAGLYLIIAMFFAVARFIQIYLMAVLSLSFIFCLGYIVVPFVLFQHTYRYFEKWILLCIGHILTPVIMFAFMGMMSVAMDLTLIDGDYSVVKTIFGKNANADSFANANCQSVEGGTTSDSSCGTPMTTTGDCFKDSVRTAETDHMSKENAVKAVSPTGARGMYQMLRSTAKDVAKTCNGGVKYDEALLSCTPPKDGDINACEAYQSMLNDCYMKYLDKNYANGNQDDEAFAYNQGQGSLLKIRKAGCKSTDAVCIQSNFGNKYNEGIKYVQTVRKASATCTPSTPSPTPTPPPTPICADATGTGSVSRTMIGAFCKDNFKSLFYIDLSNIFSGSGTHVSQGPMGGGSPASSPWMDTGQKASDYKNAHTQDSALVTNVGFDLAGLDIDKLAAQSSKSTSDYLSDVLISFMVALLMAYIMFSLLSYIPNLASDLASSGQMVKAQMFGEAEARHTFENAQSLAKQKIAQSQAGKE